MSKNALAALIAAEDTRPSEDKLERLRELGTKLRDELREIEDAEERLSARKAIVQKIQFEELPDLFGEVGVDRVGLPAAGNLPACDVIMTPYYKANIAADWEPVKREEAFNFLEQQGAGDLIRVVVSVSFNKEEYDDAMDVAALLRQHGYTPDIARSVPWGTLTAWVRERYEQLKSALSGEELAKIGATVGRRASLKERKQK